MNINIKTFRKKFFSFDYIYTDIYRMAISVNFHKIIEKSKAKQKQFYLYRYFIV